MILSFNELLVSVMHVSTDIKVKCFVFIINIAISSLLFIIVCWSQFMDDFSAFFYPW